VIAPQNQGGLDIVPFSSIFSSPALNPFSQWLHYFWDCVEVLLVYLQISLHVLIAKNLYLAASPKSPYLNTYDGIPAVRRSQKMPPETRRPKALPIPDGLLHKPH